MMPPPGVNPPLPPQQPVGTPGPRVHIYEKKAWSTGGFLALFFGLGLALACVILIGVGTSSQGIYSAIGGLLLIPAGLLLFLILGSLTVISPGDTAVLTFFGRYVGTVRRTGLSLVMPLTSKKKVSVKVHNFETNELKVNDLEGNPINIAGIVVWQVADTAKAIFGVEFYEQFVHVQAESALRHVAMSYPYDSTEAGEISLRGNTEVVCQQLAAEVAERVAIAGLEILEVRISSLAYAPEIAQAMLQRQQAAAIIAAREKIVAGAVGMVESALTSLDEGGKVELDDASRAAMVSNLLVVLTSEKGASPVVNTGSR